jgi:hypothetical protein
MTKQSWAAMSSNRIKQQSLTPFPESLELEELPKIVINYRLTNKGNPLHELLVNRIKHHLTQSNTGLGRC